MRAPHNRISALEPIDHAVPHIHHAVAHIHKGRLLRLQQEMRAEDLPAFIVTHLPNIFYLTGFTGSAGVLVVNARDATLLTDPRYTVQAKEECSAARVNIVRSSLLAAAGVSLGSAKGRLGIEAGHLSVQQQKLLAGAAKRVRWIPWDGKVEELRAVKDASELSTMREAADIACAAWEESLPLVKPGVSEIELAAEIEYRMRRKGASGRSFDTIIASGPRGALPHGNASPKMLQKNELVVFDLGAILRGYSSDVTRTVFLGRAPKVWRERYQRVREAQEAAREALRPGATAAEVDAAARGVLRRSGLGNRFIHSTGHGLGIEVHEFPRVGQKEKVVFRAGMVVTLEPGVYFPGEGGIRIEDDAVVTDSGAFYLTSARRELIEIE